MRFAWERTASEFFLLRYVGVEGSWLLQDPELWDHGKAMEQEVIIKWSCLAEGLQAWASQPQTLLSNHPQAPGFPGFAILVYFSPAFIGKQGVELVPLESDSGALWDKGIRDSFEELMKATGFLRKMHIYTDFTKDPYMDLS